MCEKPISVDVITTESVLAKAKSKPHLKFLVPFCRRCETYGFLCYSAKLICIQTMSRTVLPKSWWKMDLWAKSMLSRPPV